MGELVFQAGLGDVIGMASLELQSFQGREEMLLCLAGALGWGQRAPAHQGATVGLNAIGRVRLGVAQGLASGPGLEEEMGVALARTCGFLWP